MSSVTTTSSVIFSYSAIPLMKPGILSTSSSVAGRIWGKIKGATAFSKSANDSFASNASEILDKRVLSSVERIALTKDLEICLYLMDAASLSALATPFQKPIT